MKAVIGLIGVMCSFFCQSQSFSSEVFHKGMLVTSEKDTVKGKLKYDMETNIVFVALDGKVKTFSSHAILYFEFDDEVLGTFRQFYSIPHKVSYEYKIPILFELLYEGPLSMLAREALVQRARTINTSYWGGNFYTKLTIERSFYFLTTEGGVIRFSGQKKDLYAIMAKKKSEIKKYIKKNRLKTNNEKDLIKIIAFYNSI